MHYFKFRHITSYDPEIPCFPCARRLAKRLQHTSRKTLDLAHLHVPGRIVRTLLDLAKQPSAITHPDGMKIHNHASRDRRPSAVHAKWQVGY